MIKAQYDCDVLLKNLISQYGYYVDLLSCNEYTIWYLIRQAGIDNFIPVIGTRAFINQEMLIDSDIFILHEDKNIDCIIKNLNEYYHIGIHSYDDKKEDIHSFICKALEKNQFVYTYYDHFYDSLVDGERKHDYHGHPITGYDSKHGLYESIYPDIFLVKIDDMQMMMKHCTEIFNARPYYFYLDMSNAIDVKVIKNHVRQDLIEDCNNIESEWKEEITAFEKYIQVFPSIYDFEEENQVKYVLEQRILFNTILEGVNGNFLLKLQLIQEIFGINTEELRMEFLQNRRKSVIIANMFRKASILVTKDKKYFQQCIIQTINKISDVFIRENENLLMKYVALMKGMV